jgi:hypothetical protein
MPDIATDSRGGAQGILLIGFEPSEAARLTAALARVGRPAYSAAAGRVACGDTGRCSPARQCRQIGGGGR